MPGRARSVRSGPVSAESPSPSKRIPEATVVRLPVYQRILAELVRNSVSTVSSEQLATLALVNAAKVRKDLSLLGSFGTRGSGYDPAFLIAQIDRALGVDENWPVAVVGIGNLGRALTNSQGFATSGFRVTGLFDVDPAVVGEEIRGIRVRHMDEIPALATSERPAIGVITTPGGVAQQVADTLVEVGVTSLLNFAPRVLDRAPLRAPALCRPLHRAAGARVLPGPARWVGPGQNRPGGPGTQHPLGGPVGPLRSGLRHRRAAPGPCLRPGDWHIR